MQNSLRDPRECLAREERRNVDPLALTRCRYEFSGYERVHHRIEEEWDEERCSYECGLADIDDTMLCVRDLLNAAARKKQTQDGNISKPKNSEEDANQFVCIVYRPHAREEKKV